MSRRLRRGQCRIGRRTLTPASYRRPVVNLRAQSQSRGSRPSPDAVDEVRLQQLLVAVYSEIGEDRRARGSVENTYTAAFVAASGAVCWGVAAVSPAEYSGSFYWQHPAFSAAIGTYIVAIAVIATLLHHREIYIRVKLQQNAVLKQLADRQIAGFSLPRGIVYNIEESYARSLGHLYSIGLVVFSYLSVEYFCLTVLDSPRANILPLCGVYAFILIQCFGWLTLLLARYALKVTWPSWKTFVTMRDR